MLADRTLLELGEEQLWAPIRPKVLGAWNLHAATRALPLDFFVMYSSVASLLGSPGQAAYAAGNAFLDALAHARVALGLPAVSVQWGPFAEVGLAAARGNRGERLSSQGLESFAPHEGNELLARVLERPRAEVGLLRVSLRRWFESNPQASGMRFLAELEGEHAQPREVEGGRLRATLERAPAAERASLIEGHVLEQLGRVLRASPSRIDRRAPFVSLGVDSLTSLELRNRLEASLGMRLPAALLFTYATPAGLAEHLADVLVPAGPAPPAGGEPEAPRPSSSDLGDLGVSELLAALDDELLLARKVETPR